MRQAGLRQHTVPHTSTAPNPPHLHRDRTGEGYLNGKVLPSAGPFALLWPSERLVPSPHCVLPPPPPVLAAPPATDTGNHRQPGRQRYLRPAHTFQSAPLLQWIPLISAALPPLPSCPVPTPPYITPKLLAVRHKKGMRVVGSKTNLERREKAQCGCVLFKIKSTMV